MEGNRQKLNFRNVPGILLAFMYVFVFAACRETPKEAPADLPPEVEGAVTTVTPEASEEADSPLWTPYDDSQEVAANAEHPNPRMRYKLIQSRVLDKNVVFTPLYEEVQKMPDSMYERLKPLIPSERLRGVGQ